MELSIEEIPAYFSCDDSTFKIYLYVGDFKEILGPMFYDYEDCRKYAEQLVKEFSKEGIAIRHDKIYDLI